MNSVKKYWNTFWQAATKFYKAEIIRFMRNKREQTVYTLTVIILMMLVRAYFGIWWTIAFIVINALSIPFLAYLTVRYAVVYAYALFVLRCWIPTKRRVDVAWKNRAKKHHPDVGGSHEKMSDINWAHDFVGQSYWQQAPA